MQDHRQRTRAARLDLRLAEHERAALESLAAARRTTPTGALVELVLAAAPRDRDLSVPAESKSGQEAGGAVRVTA